MPCLDTGFIIESADLVIFLQAYFDESGKSPQHDVASFCGFAAKPEQWGRFCDMWSRAVMWSELRTTFKAKDALRYRHRLSPKIPAQTVEQRVDALAPLVAAIRETVAFGIAVCIDCRAFRSMPESDRAALGHEPHYWAFQQALLLIRKTAEQWSPSESDIRIALCCDEEERYAMGCLKLFVNIRRDYPEMRNRFISIGFGDDEYFPQLQAADLIASVARQEADHTFHAAPFDMRPLYDALCANDSKLAPVVFSFMDAGLLAGIARAEKARIERRKLRKTTHRL